MMDTINTDATAQPTTVDQTPTAAPVAEVTTQTGTTPTSEPQAPVKPAISDEGKARLEAEAKYLLDNPERKAYMERLLAEKTVDPVAELDKKWELKYAKLAIAKAYPQLEKHIDTIAGNTPDEILANAKVLAEVIQPAQGLPTEVGTTTPPQVVPQPAPVEAPAQAGTPLPVPESIANISPLKRSYEDVMAQIKAQEAAGMDMDGACESAR